MFDSEDDGKDDARAREVKELIQALSGHSGLIKFVLYYAPVGRNGPEALSSLLHNQGSNLAVLDFKGSEIEGESAIILANGLAGSSTLK